MGDWPDGPAPVQKGQTLPSDGEIMADLAVDGARLWARLMAMARIGAIPGDGSCRLALSDADEAGRTLFRSWCAARGYPVTHDRIGNLFVRRAGQDDTAAPVVMGSHLDTQPTGGRFDGILGVLAGLEILETLDDAGLSTRRPVEVAVWTNEEGARFRPAMMGSGVHCGLSDLAATLAIADRHGITAGAELARHGYRDGAEPGRHPIAVYVELHIEQGPILEAAGKTIGIVTGGQAIRWYQVTLTGAETHAGPVPMALRRDPVPVLARVLDLVAAVGATDTDARATVGVIGAEPGSINVVPGRITLTVDLRHPDDAQLDRMHATFMDGIAGLSGAKVRVQAENTWHSPMVRFDPDLVARVRASAATRGYPAAGIISGAGHDAFHLSRIVPTTMVFVPCRDGISHNPAEYAAPDHVAAGANVLLDVVRGLAGG